MRIERRHASTRRSEPTNPSVLRGRRPLRNELLVAFSVIGLLCGATCSPPPDPDSAQGQAIDRPLGEASTGSLDCRAGDCLDWHRIRVVDRGTLRLGARATRSDKPDARFAVILADGFGETIERLEDLGEAQRELTRVLEPGFYLIGVESPARAKALDYQLTTDFEPIVAPPPPVRPKVEPKPPSPTRPTHRSVDAEVLEVEGQLSQPTGVLLDLGRDRGVTEGMTGELLEDGRIVGKIRVLDVYEEGSRATVELPLLRPITPRVKAVLHFPESRGSGDGRGSDPGRSSDPGTTDRDAAQP